MQAVRVKRSASAKLHDNYKGSARVAHLEYVTDQMPGITRKKKGNGFEYWYHSNIIKSKETLNRIKKLAIPPAWTNVWICTKDNGHIQATGFDLRNRKQYRYHSQWNEVRNQTKFHRLYEFGKALPAIRKKLEEDICLSVLCKEKVIATVISLMERTYIRIGNSEYEKLYGSYGLTTLKDGHVTIQGPTLKFSFKGKKGIYHSVTIKNKRIAKIVKACRDIPGKELFQYINEDGTRCSIDSGMVNDYIRDATGGKSFSAKDFRTWAGTLCILGSFKSLSEKDEENDYKKNVILALDEVSKKLGNTRSVCRKYYVHPGIIKLYEENNLKKYLNSLEDIEHCDGLTDLTPEEKVLMKILQKIN